jgi:hypothetical protein
MRPQLLSARTAEAQILKKYFPHPPRSGAEGRLLQAPPAAAEKSDARLLPVPQAGLAAGISPTRHLDDEESFPVRDEG